MRVIILCLSFLASVLANTTLNEVKQRGFLKCGVNQGLPGFASLDHQGQWRGFDVSFCQAIAAAIFKDSTKVIYAPLSKKVHFSALKSKDIDVLAHNTTWTMHRDTALGLAFARVNFYDGQGFLVPKSLEINSVDELDGATICTAQGTTTEMNLSDYFLEKGLSYKPLYFDRNEFMFNAYEEGRCDAITGDVSALASGRFFLKKADEHIVLPEIISKEPLALMVRSDDDQWRKIIAWVINVTINAEFLGVNQANVDDFNHTPNSKIRRLLGTEKNFGQALGLHADFGYQVIKQVGNYADIYNRNLGPESKINLPRGLNALWNQGGIIYAPPIR